MAYATKEKRNAYARRWREKNREKAREAQRRAAAKNLDGERARNQRWHQLNREKKRARNRRWAAANREKTQKWMREHPEYTRSETRKTAHAKRRARKRGAAVEKVVARIVFERDAYICQICGDATSGTYPAPTSPSLDHIVPLAKGGSHSYANTQCAHLRCNKRKGACMPPAPAGEAESPHKEREH